MKFLSKYLLWDTNTRGPVVLLTLIWHLVLVYILMLLYMYIAPGQGQTTPWGQNFNDIRKAFSLCPYVASFKMISSKSDFIHIFNDLIHVYIPGASFKMISLNSDFIHIFLMFFHMYIDPGQGQTTLCGQNLVSTEKACQFAHLLQVSKPETHGPQHSPECTVMKAIFSQNTVNVACKKN